MPEATLDALKSRIRAAWTAGNFGLIAETYAEDAAQFVSRLAIPPGAKVLDACCGSGNLALPAARGGAHVTGVDIAPNLLEQARARAGLDGLDVRFEEGDVERLPYADASFDVTLSMFGVMFAPRPEVAAAELLRVTRPGGFLALASWTSRSFIAELFRTTARFVPPSPGAPSPLDWGEEGRLYTLFRSGAERFRFTTRSIRFHFDESPEDVAAFWAANYGPAERAYASLAATPDRQQALSRAWADLWRKFNQSEVGGTLVESTYLEAVFTRRASG